MPRVAKDVINSYFTVLGSQLISAPLTLLYLSFVTRIMGPSNYGHFVLFLGSVQFFFAVFISWNRNAVVRFGSEEFTKNKKVNDIFYVQILISGISILLSFIIIFIFKKNIAVFTGLTNNIYLYLILFLIFYSIFDFFTQLLLVTHRITRYAMTTVIRQSIILILAIVIFLFAKKLTPLNLIYTETLSFIALSLFAVFPLFKSGYFRPVVFKTNLLYDVLTFVWPISIHVILGYFLIWADTLFIRAYLDFASVGRYEIANRMIQYISNLIMPLSIIAFPAAVSIKSFGREDLIFRYVDKIMPQISFFWSIFIMLLLVSSTYIFKFTFGSQYMASVLIFEVLLIGITFQILSVMCTSLLQAYNLSKAFLFITPITVAINLIGDLILIPKIGMLGASISKSTALMAAGLLYLFHTIKGLRIKTVSYTYSIFFLVLPLILLGLFITSQKPANRLFLTGIIITFMYFLVKHMKIFNYEEVKLIKKLNMPFYFKAVIEKIYIWLC